MPTGTWALGWATGDVVTAAEFAKGVGSIYDTTLGIAAANVDVTGIVATYANLIVSVYCREDGATTVDDLKIRFNNDSAANYDYESVNANNVTASATNGSAGTSAVCGHVVGASSTASMFSANFIYIPNYAGTTGFKPLIAMSTGLGGSAANSYAKTVGGQWRSAAAINRITLIPGTGNFIAGTRVTIYAAGA